MSKSRESLRRTFFPLVLRVTSSLEPLHAGRQHHLPIFAIILFSFWVLLSWPHKYDIPSPDFIVHCLSGLRCLYTSCTHVCFASLNFSSCLGRHRRRSRLPFVRFPRVLIRHRVARSRRFRLILYDVDRFLLLLLLLLFLSIV